MKIRKFKVGDLVQSVDWGGDRSVTEVLQYHLHAGETEPIFNTGGTKWAPTDIGLIVQIFNPSLDVFFGPWYKLIVPNGLGWTTAYDIKKIRVKSITKEQEIKVSTCKHD